MNVKSIFILFLFNGFLFSQVNLEKEIITNNSYKLVLNVTPPQYEIVSNGEREYIKFFDANDIANPGAPGLPKIDVFIAIEPLTNPLIKITPKYFTFLKKVPALQPEVRAVNDSIVIYEQKFIPKPDKENLYSVNGFLWTDGFYCAHLTLGLAQFNYSSNLTGIIESYEIEFLFNNNIQPRSVENLQLEVPSYILNKATASKLKHKRIIESSSLWFSLNQEYLKMGVNRDGIYRIYYDDLLANGVDLSNVNPGTFQLFLRGQEIPVYVYGEGDEIFQEGEYIEFLGFRNMGGKHREVSQYGQPYNEYLDRYSDTTIYWLTWNFENGKRVNEQDENLDLIQTSMLEYYSEIIHGETNNWFDFSMADLVRREMPFWYENKTWHQGNLGIGTRNINFTVNNVYPNGTVSLFAKLQSYATNIDQNAHLLSIYMNSLPHQDSGYVHRYQQKVLTARYPSNTLSSGSNTLKINSYQTAAFPNLCIFDWHEIEYSRYLIPQDGKLVAKFPFLENNNVYELIISGVNTNNFTIWKYQDSYKKYNLSTNNDSLHFKDTLNSKTTLCYSDEDKVHKPIYYYRKQFTDLRNSQNQADYIAVTNKKFEAVVNDYCSFIENSYEINTQVVTTEDIYDQYSFGFFNPEVIREFLKNTHSHWREPWPQYVVLIGSATYDYFGNKALNQGAPKTYNYVPSFGASVSDNWFVTWDTTGAFIPQMNIGRIPITSAGELEWYRSKHQLLLENKYNLWNKRFLFFSGGTGNDQNQISLLKEVNQYVIDNYVIPPPLAGDYKHFYKTINPTSNFGPYGYEEIQNSIDSGAIFISYIGHSGTQTWDNSITDPSQLENKINRSPLITDFGCSTARFAEPDVISFSQLFLLDERGQTIAYIGNSSLGFLSTSTTVPKIFYKKVLSEGYLTISEALKQAKLELIQNYGSSSVNQLFTLTNTLIGDPILKLQLPQKPNLNVSNESIALISSQPTDQDDSLRLIINYSNQGLAFIQQLKIKIIDSYQDQIIFEKILIRDIPSLADSFEVSIPIKFKPGSHHITVTLDFENEVDEIYESDNTCESIIQIPSVCVRNLFPNNFANGIDNRLILLNPILEPNSSLLQVLIYDDRQIHDPIELNLSLDTFYTSLNLAQLQSGERYLLNQKITGNDDYGSAQSFIAGSNYDLVMNDSISFSEGQFNNTRYQETGVSLDTKIHEIKALSAGFNDGNSAVITLNDQNYIPENTLRGHHVCLFDTASLKFIEYKRFDILGGEANRYINFLDTLSTKFIVAIAISDEGRVTSTALKNKIKELGSVHIDNLLFRGSWAIVGYKGALTGTVPEAYSNPFNGRVEIDTTFHRSQSSGSYLTSRIGPASGWKELKLAYNYFKENDLVFKLLGIRKDRSIDTITTYSANDSLINLTNISSSTYPHLQLLAEFNYNGITNRPFLQLVEFDYIKPPELGLNYQVVSIQSDTITQGESNTIKFYVYNAGETAADSFGVKLSLIKPDKSIYLLQTFFVESLDPMSRIYFEYDHRDKFENGWGEMAFEIQIDPNNNITELYKDNNKFRIPFFVKKDTTTSITSALLNVTFDGKEILDGEYVSSNPSILISVDYQSSQTITDSTSLDIYLDGRRIPHSDLKMNPNQSADNFSYDYKPLLNDGEHYLKIAGKNAIPFSVENLLYEKIFLVSSKAKILDVYNYPNPFTSSTNFTFKLTQVPEELEIKIYTVAGRLIKEIKKYSSDLNTNFNSIYWDGKDEDGSNLANGVYLYKVIIRDKDHSDSVIQKLAVVK